jgi:hypothetical protein
MDNVTWATPRVALLQIQTLSDDITPITVREE